MEKEKKKIWWIVILSMLAVGLLVLILYLAGVFGAKDGATNSTEKKHSTTQSQENRTEIGSFQLKEGNYYWVIVNNDTAFLQINDALENTYSGQYFPLIEGSDCVTSYLLTVNIDSTTSIVTLNNEEYIFSIQPQEVQQLFDGEPHKIISSTNQEYTFTIIPYTDPQYEPINDLRYTKELYNVSKKQNIVFGEAKGYWTSWVIDKNDDYWALIKEGLRKSQRKKTLPLSMDLYLPQIGSMERRTESSPCEYPHPLIVFLHGGAFYVGDKEETHIAKWCHHFAAMGYVTASINYRLGFTPSKRDIQNTGYDAVEDVRSAIKYLITHQQEYHLDTSMIFLAGTSAGSIIALNVAFRKANDIHIKAVANMWGAVTDLNQLKYSKVDIVSFHGDADALVPYNQGYPFADISKSVGKALFDKMYGSKSIYQKAKELGLNCKLYTFPGEGHALHQNQDRTLNLYNFQFIQNNIASFFYSEMIPNPVRIEQDRNDKRHFFINNSNVKNCNYTINGGYIIRHDEKNVWVVWKNTTPQSERILEASGYYTNGIGFNVRK